MFTHLHVHSHFSFKDATPSPQALATKTKELGMTAVAMTDHNTLAGAIRFYKACLAQKVKPIIGCEITLDTDHHIVLLAMSLAGYSNLCRLVTSMHLAEPGKEPRATLGAVKQYSKDCICLTGCGHSELSSSVARGEYREARLFLEKLKSIFPGRCYVELENPLTHESNKTIRALTSLAEDLELPLVASNNVHFLSPEGYQSRDLLVAMGENVTVGHVANPKRHPNNERYFKTSAQMEALFAHYPEAIANTQLIADCCNVELPLGEYRFPYFGLPQGKDGFTYLRELCYYGLNRSYPEKEQPIERLEYELTVIRDLGFVEYFLVVWDIVNFARREGIRCAGRGSAADSLVAYVLGMTSVDPVAHNLLFERFLNPERKGMPDIDMDFDSARRDEVLAYVYHRYAADKVAMVGTVNTFNARSALREVAKALSFTKVEIDRLATFMPHTSAGRMTEAIDKLPELKNFPRGPRYERLLNICAELDGAPRHLSVHLGGVVVSREALTDLVPLQWSAKGVIVTQYDKDDLEALGLVKMDLLGLRILSAIQSTVDTLALEGIIVDTEKIANDDAKTYELLRSGKTIGVFQLESPGMRELLGRLQPTEFSDVCANIALFRPGPMQADMISPFIARRHGLEEVKYAHPSLATVLGETYGVIIYQEQVLQAAAHMAGFSLGQADLLRRAMTKSIDPEVMTEIKSNFISGCKATGVDDEAAVLVFKQLASFAAYGFNKAHAATFGLTAYHTAYLKAHYPAHFFTGLLNHQPMGYYPPRVVLNDARVWGISILPLDICCSHYDFTVENDGIRVGLKAVPSFTLEQYNTLLANREAKQLQSLEDALIRLPYPEGLWQKFLKAGALDSLGQRQTLGRRLDRFFGGDSRKHSGQFSLNLAEAEEPYVTELSMRERLLGELEITGLCYTEHPLRLYEGFFKKLGIATSCRLLHLPHESKVRVAGLIVSRQTPPTRSKQRVIFLTIEDHTGLVDIAVFAQAQAKYAQNALGCSLLLVEGTLRRTGVCGVSVTADKVLDLREVVRKSGGR